MSIHDNVKVYFEPKVRELAEDVLYFNTAPDAEDTISLVTSYGSKVMKRFVTGDEQKEYGFSIIIDKTHSAYTDDVNLEAMNFAQAFMDWLDEQNASRNFPDLGDGKEVIKLENLQNMPNLAGVNEQKARYMIQARIIYIERKTL